LTFVVTLAVSVSLPAHVVPDPPEQLSPSAATRLLETGAVAFSFSSALAALVPTSAVLLTVVEPAVLLTVVEPAGFEVATGDAGLDPEPEPDGAPLIATLAVRAFPSSSTATH